VFARGLGCGGKAGEPESWRNQTRPEIKSFTPENKGKKPIQYRQKQFKTTQTTPALVIIKTKQIHHHRKNRD